MNRRAWVIGSGLDVWAIAHMAEDFGSPEALAKESQRATRRQWLDSSAAL